MRDKSEIMLRCFYDKMKITPNYRNINTFCFSSYRQIDKYMYKYTHRSEDKQIDRQIDKY